MNSQNDFILVNKPKGWTSFDIVKFYKNKLKAKKVGHAGTLDPLAEGLLILAVNENTKKLSQLVGLDKVYEFEILFGKKTETGDMEGKILKSEKIDKIDKIKLEKILNSLIGEIKMPVPKYSAVKINGKKLYELARKGKFIDEKILPIRTNKIYNLQLQNLYKKENSHFAKILVECSSGTYIRSLVEAIGEELDIPCVAYNIKRTKIGNYKLTDAINITSTNVPTCQVGT